MCGACMAGQDVGLVGKSSFRRLQSRKPETSPQEPKAGTSWVKRVISCSTYAETRRRTPGNRLAMAEPGRIE
jgi:hypothetical protein